MNKEVLKKVLHTLKPYRFMIGLSVVMAFFTVVSTLLIPILIGNAVDCILGKGQVDFQGLAVILTEMGVIIGVTAVCQWLQNILNNRIVYAVTRDIRREAFQSIMHQPLSYIDSHPFGDILSRVIADVDQFADGLLMGFTQLFTGVLTIVGTLGFMFYVNIPIGLLVVVLTPLSLFVAKFIAGRTHSFFTEQAAARGKLTAYINEMVSNEKVIQAYGREQEVQTRFGELNETLRKASKSAVFYSSLVNPSTRFVNSVVYAAVGLAGALFVLNNPLFTVGSLTCFLTYANQYMKPFNEISGVITELQNAFVSAGRIFELIELEPEKPDPEPAAVLEKVRGQVSFEDVSFSYVPEKPLIRGFNMQVEPGRHIAIVGRTGCGKTTLINLLMRFYDVNSGEIRIDGVRIEDMKRSDERSAFGMVLQETWIRKGTIRDNIRLSRPSASEEEIIAAARAAHAHSFIRRLKHGYDTEVGEDGAGLSEGQKQLLCIARLMLALPPMLILDEATSSIDTRTEMRIQDSFLKMMEGRTSFIVAHRLSTIRNADTILVMKDGSIIEQGSHEELLEKKGDYYELYRSQFAGVAV